MTLDTINFLLFNQFFIQMIRLNKGKTGRELHMKK